MSDLSDELIDDVSYLNPEEKDRHGCVTAWLILMIIAGVVTTGLYLFMGDLIQESSPEPIPKWALYAMTFIGMVNIGFAVLILQWKKIGFYGFAMMSVITFILNVFMGQDMMTSLMVFLGVLILYAILQINGRLGKSTWEYLE